MPPAVAAPYERGKEVTRQAKSQRERDREALGLAGRKGIMLGELRRLAADDRLDDASVMKAEWFAEQVKAAASGARLDDLADLFAAERIRPRGWFQRPVAITAGYPGDDTEDDYDEYDDDEDQDDEPAALATPASIAAQQHRAQPAGMTWAGALAVRGWRLASAPGSCWLIDERGQRCPAECNSPAMPDGHGGFAWLCQWHYGALGATIQTDHQRRQTA